MNNEGLTTETSAIVPQQGEISALSSDCCYLRGGVAVVANNLKHERKALEKVVL